MEWPIFYYLTLLINVIFFFMCIVLLCSTARMATTETEDWCGRTMRPSLTFSELVEELCESQKVGGVGQNQEGIILLLLL